jgi:hypothetical protein
VQSVSGNSFVLEQPGGTTITVTTSSSTTFVMTESVAVSQLTIGKTIVAAGTPNSDGSITAVAIDQGAGSFPGLGGPGGLGGLGGFGPGFGGRFGGDRGGFGHGGFLPGTGKAPAAGSPTPAPSA